MESDLEHDACVMPDDARVKTFYRPPYGIGQALDIIVVTNPSPFAAQKAEADRLHSEYMKMLRSLLEPNSVPENCRNTDEVPIFFNHRSPSAEDLPTSLMHPALGRFRDNITRREPDQDDVRFTVNMCTSMSRDFNNETDRVEEFVSLLASHYKLHLHGLVIRKHSTGFSLLQGVHMVLHAESKSEQTSDLTMQKSVCFSTHLSGHDEMIVTSHRLPVFLVDLAGPLLLINTATYGSNNIVDTYPFALNLACSIFHTEQFCGVLDALKAGILELAGYYRNALLTTPSSQRQYPYFSSFKLGPNVPEVELTYVERLIPRAPCLVFLTQGSTRESPKQDFDYLGIAPAVIYFGELPGGWKVVVMECITTPFKLLSDCRMNERELLRPAIEAAVRTMHGARIVHGDLRGVNIYGDLTSEVVKIIDWDWDWADEAGKATYPLM
ncbi:hypothetical protein BD410DRAFT_898490 [Rickenella mellea]|uniref:Protein kinase domain-containing protein n=1 Tax=Rickenella mellea TaxID=50990 RepID=A0A4Y7Q4X1_9AGAM|nr:hypothetical protein BD410DRAFT_898490 [Rickenella mellea]